MKNTLALAFTLIAVSCSTTSAPKPSQQLISETVYQLKGSVSIGKTAAGQDVNFGGISSLFKKDGSTLYALTDRGPNGYSVNDERPFLLPAFSPTIFTLKLNSDKTYEVVQTLPLKKKDGAPLTGLPNSRTEENPIDIFGFMHSLDADGLDTEALAIDEDGSIWIGDEYAPSIVHFSEDGKMQRRLTPANNDIPKMYAERKLNRGFEALAIDKNRIFGFLQSPLPMDKGFARIVEIDKETLKTTAEYFYGFDAGMEKIGDAVSLGNNKFLVVEMNGKKGPESKKLIYKITLNSGDDFVKKELIVDLKNTSFKEIEKVEGLTLLNTKQLVLTNDNDFQIAGPTDFKTGMTPFNKEPSMLLVLDFAEDITK